MKLKLILLTAMTMVMGVEQSAGQNPRFGEEKFAYYWAIDKLISAKEPVFALGVEYKTPYRLSLSVDGGVGKYYNNNLFYFDDYRAKVTNSNVFRTSVHLKYFYKRKYSMRKLRRWQRRSAQGRKVKLRNLNNTRYYIGLQLSYYTRSYEAANGSYYDPNKTSILSFSLSSYSHAAIKSSRFRVGITNGIQRKLPNSRIYAELAISAGFQLQETGLFDVVPTLSSPSSFYNFSEDYYVGQNISPYIHFHLNLGLF